MFTVTVRLICFRVPRLNAETGVSRVLRFPADAVSMVSLCLQARTYGTQTCIAVGSRFEKV